MNLKKMVSMKKNLVKLSLAVVVASVGLSAFAGYSLELPAFLYEAQSSDGLPLKGMPFSYNLNVERLTVMDGSGFTPTPTLSKWRRQLEEAKVLGKTDPFGQFFYVDQKIMKSDSMEVRNAEVHLFAPSYYDVCLREGSRMGYSIDLKLHNCAPASDIRLTEDHTVDFFTITCKSVYTWQEIQDMIEEADKKYCQ